MAFDLKKQFGTDEELEIEGVWEDDCLYRDIRITRYIPISVTPEVLVPGIDIGETPGTVVAGFADNETTERS